MVTLNRPRQGKIARISATGRGLRRHWVRLVIWSSGARNSAPTYAIRSIVLFGNGVESSATLRRNSPGLSPRPTPSARLGSFRNPAINAPNSAQSGQLPHFRLTEMRLHRFQPPMNADRRGFHFNLLPNQRSSACIRGFSKATKVF